MNEPGWRVLHPTDFSEASEVAFVHALKLTLATRGTLHLLHVSSHDESVQWQSFPSVRETLERWGMLPAGSPPNAVGTLGITIEKVEAAGDDPVRVTHEFLQRHPADVIVLATHQRGGLARWWRPSVAERIARSARQVTLFVPGDIGGFVDAVTGLIDVQRILIPVDGIPAPQPAIEAAAALASLPDGPPVTFRLVHVGDAEFPVAVEPERPGWTWQRQRLAGEPATALLSAIEDFDPDLVVMTTAGHDGFMDALRGSTTERVLRAIRCPLLAVSAAARLARLTSR
jgi:nucleotide-binding universal stress UspA family protein